MILALFIYFCAHEGLLVATPVVVNTLAAGAVITTYSSKVNLNFTTR